MNHSGVGRVFGLNFWRAISIFCLLFLNSFSLLTSTPMILASITVDEKILAQFSLIRNVLAYYGVELFFVLSGFLIGSILLSLAPGFKNPMVLPAFWQRRWVRTLPNYFLFLGISTGPFLITSAKLPDLLSYFVFLQNWLW